MSTKHTPVPLARCKSAPTSAMLKARPAPKAAGAPRGPRLLRMATAPTRAMARRPPFLRLPEDVLLLALAYLQKHQLTVFAGACHETHRLAYHASLWSTVAPATRLSPRAFAHLPSLCPALTALDFSRCRSLDDGLLAQFANRCPGLRRVNVACCAEITDSAALILMTCCPKISALTLEGCPLLSDKAFAGLRGLPELTYLNVSYCPTLTHEAMAAAFGTPRGPLVDLNLDGCSQLLDDSVTLVAGACRGLRCLHLDGEFLTDASLQAVARGLPRIQLLHVSFCTGLTDATLDALQGCPELVSLRLKKGNGFTASGFQRFFARPWPELCALDLTDCQRVDDAVCEELASHCPHLLRLNLSWCWHVSDGGVKALLAGLPLLTQLDLCGLKRLSNVVVAMIPWRLRGLTFLSLTQCNGVSDAVVSLIVGGMPGITVLDYYDAPHGDPHGKFRM
jgi:hypothetical protein